MKLVNFKVLAIGVLTGVLAVGCGKDNGTSNPPPAPVRQNQEQTNDSVDTQGYQIKCKKAEIFAPPQTMSLKQEDLLRLHWGKFELDQVHIHHKATTLDGKYIGSFYGVATRYIGDDTFMGATNIRETDLKFECDEYNKDSGYLFISGVNLPIASMLHSPSGRITVFDEGGQMDNPQFNLPLASEVHFDSIGSAHYKPVVGVSGPPYLTDRYFHDVIRKYAVAPSFYARSNGGFEMRISWSELRDLGGGRSFNAETDAVITYKISE